MHDVGQVLYIVLTKKHKVIPVRIAEQIVRRSINGESIQYLVQVPGKSQLMDLKSLGVEVYPTLQEVREKLRENIWKAVEDMMHKAEELTRETFGDEHLISPNLDSSIPQDASTSLRVVLDSGQVANVNIDDTILQQTD